MRLIIFILCLFAFAACRKSNEITADPNVRLSFSSDTVLFDTVFTTIGSTHRKLKIYNRNAKALNISSISLANGNESPFELLINGQPINTRTDIQLDGRDSITIYAKVTIDPSDMAQPFLVEDAILFSVNGNKQEVALIAYGQNAHFVNNLTISSNEIWTDDLPYVVYNSVNIAANANLVIRPGTKILFHRDAAMHIFGTLTARGTADRKIVFKSDRLENLYDNEPGQWIGLHFHNSSIDSELHHSIIENGLVGIMADSLPLKDHEKLVLSNTIVRNMEVAGFVGYQTSLKGFNNLFHNCGQYLIYGTGGGTYDLKQNTFAAYNFNFPRKTAAVYFSDFRNTTQQGTLAISMLNNIIWGSLDEEFVVEIKTKLGFSTDIRNNLIKTNTTTYNIGNNIINTDPSFTDPEAGNFSLDVGSAALNKGLDLTGGSYYQRFLSKDLNNKNRLFPSELGCYENN